ncbi:MAG: type II secretion system secretin GspD [Usitatibacter sp.]
MAAPHFSPRVLLHPDAMIRAAFLLAAAAITTSCSLFPPGMRGQKDPAAAQELTPVIIQVPLAPPPAAPVEPKLYTGTGNFTNTKPPRNNTDPGPEEASLNFEGLDIREVAKVILADYLHSSYTVHPAVSGTVTFRTVRPIPFIALLPTLEMLLRQNNAAVILEEGIYKVVPITAVRGSVSPRLGGTERPIPQGYSILVVPLKYVGTREMIRLLQPFAADNTIVPDDVRNLLILAGNQRELKHLIDTVELFDVDWLAGYSVGLFPVKGVDVKTLTQDLDKIFGATAQSPLAGIVRVIPIERMNALLVVTTQPRYLEMAKNWLERIDQSGGTSGGTRLYVYQVRNGKAENLAQLVGDLFSTRRTSTTAPTLAPGARPTEIRSAPFGQAQPQPQTTTTSVTPGPATFQLPGGVGATSSDVRVIADKDTNTLLILAAPGDYEIVENALRRLDVVRRQVLVEVLLAEVTLSDDLAFGINWFISTRNRTSGTLTSIPGQLPPNGRVPSATNVIPPFSGLQLINLVGANEVRAVLNTLGADGRTQILAAPNIMVLDNEKAEIKVGDRISVQTQAQTGVGTSSGVLNSFQYLETGILLAVTPRINSGGMVTLEINQEVSEPKAAEAGNPNPNVATRNAKTSVQVASGESIALGGLIRENRQRTSNGLPLLSKIPVIGALFGEQEFHRTRTELVLIVTPKIVSDTSQARDVTDELRRKLPSLEGLLPKAPRGPPPPQVEAPAK